MKKIHTFFTKERIAVSVLLLLALGFGGTTLYFYREYQFVKSNPDMLPKKELDAITASIKRFMDLPSDEEPTLATVTDKEALKEQDFFKRAENGDKVLLYPKAGKAILYRPSTGRVVEFAPLILGASNEATPSMVPQDEQSAQLKEVTVTIYNGTKIVGLTTAYERALQKLEGVSVKNRKNASKNTYAKTLVVDLSGVNAEAAKKIAETVKGEVVKELPEGEAKPDTDILIIAAQDL